VAPVVAEIREVVADSVVVMMPIPSDIALLRIITAYCKNTRTSQAGNEVRA
jgi:hypothetical protein